MKGTEGKPGKDKFIACSSDKKYEIINPLDETVRIRGKKMDIKLIEEPDGFTYIIWKRKKYQVDILEKSQNKYTIMINGVWYSFTIETPISYKRRKFLSKISVSSKIITINAPMPGKILDIMVEENAEINQGDAILILEAMKMQNEICSQVAGKVKKIYCRQNDTVSKDDVLVEIERIS